MSETREPNWNPHSITPTSNAKPNLTNDQMNAIYHKLLEQLKNETPPRGSSTELSNEYNVCLKAVSQIWHQARLLLQEGAEAAQVTAEKLIILGALREVRRKFRRQWKTSLTIIEKRIKDYQMTHLYMLERCIMQEALYVQS